MPVIEEISFGIESPVAATSSQRTPQFPVSTKEGFVESEPGLIADFLPKYVSIRVVFVSFAKSALISFLFRFLSCFDRNRNALADLYGDQSIFSLSVNPVPSERGALSRSDKYFEAWWGDNRNLGRVKQTGGVLQNEFLPTPHHDFLDKRLSLLYVGASNIIKCFSRLPETKHPLEEGHEKKRFLTDSVWLEPRSVVRVMITVHGELLDGGLNNCLRFIHKCNPPIQERIA